MPFRTVPKCMGSESTSWWKVSTRWPIIWPELKKPNKLRPYTGPRWNAGHLRVWANWQGKIGRSIPARWAGMSKFTRSTLRRRRLTRVPPFYLTRTPTIPPSGDCLTKMGSQGFSWENYPSPPASILLSTYLYSTLPSDILWPSSLPLQAATERPVSLICRLLNKSTVWSTIVLVGKLL